jgi:hypothetical protein
MALETLLKFRNLDSTLDLNNHLAGFFKRGIVSGGIVAPATGLNVTVTPFKLIGVDGMVVMETSATVTLAVSANAINVVVFNSQYVSNDNPIATFEVMDLATYNAAINQQYLTVFAIVNVPNVGQVLASYIDLSSRDVIDPVGRLAFRGYLTNSAFLPTLNNRPGDFYMISSGLGDNPALFAWNGVSWLNITDSLVVASLLNAHRNNLFSNEIHLTDAQAAAAEGTFGPPGEQYSSNVTIDIPTSTITLPSPPVPALMPGLVVRLSTSPGGSLPTPLLVDTDYFAIPLTTTTLRIATSYANATALTPIPIVFSGTQSGTPILFFTGNQYVTSTDPRVPTLAEAQALAVNLDTPAGPLNGYVTGSFAIAQPVAKAFLANPGSVLTLAPGDGPVYVGTGGAGSPLQWFKLYHATAQREFVDSFGNPVTISGIFTDLGLLNPLVPSSLPAVLADHGFYTGPVYLTVSGTADLPSRLLYGQKEGLQAIDRGMFMRPNPYSAETSQEAIERFQAISGREFDVAIPTNEENINLRISINLLRQYLNGTTASDLVLDSFEYARLRNTPEFAALFPQVTGETIYVAGGAVTYTADLTLAAVQAFDSYYNTHTPDIGAIAIINWTAPVTLTSVRPGHIFTDGAGVRYRILAVNTSGNGAVMIFTGGQTVVTTLTAGSGAVTQANNPRQLELNDNLTAMFRDTIVIDGADPDPNVFESLPPGGSSVGTGSMYSLIGTPLLPNQGNAAGAPSGRPVSFITPKKQGNRYNQQVLLIGNWKNDQTNFPRQALGAVSQGCCGIEYTGYLTDITLYTSYDITMPFGFQVFIDGVYSSSASQFLASPNLPPFSLAPSNILAKLRAPEITPQPLMFPLGLSSTQIHTVRIEITQPNTGSFPLYGVEVFYNAGLLEAAGNVYLETDLVQIATQDVEPTPPPSQPLTLKGTRYTRFIDRTSKVRDVFNNSVRTLIDTSNQPLSGNPVFTNPTVGPETFIGDVYLFTDKTTSINPTANYVFKRITAKNGNILTIESANSFNSDRLELAYRIPARNSDGAPIISAPTDTDEVEYLRLGPADWDVGSANDVSQLSQFAPDNKATVMDDCHTSLLVSQCQLVNTNLEGYPTGVRMNTTSSVIVQQAFGTRMDVIFTGNQGAATIDIEIDGTYTYTVAIRGDGLERHSLFLEGAVQSHVVKISNPSIGNRVVVSQWIFHTIAPAVFNGTPISDFITLRNLTPNGPFWDFAPIVFTDPLTTSFCGVRVFDITKGHSRFFEGSSGSVIWRTVQDYTKNPRFGYYVETDRTNAQIDIDVVGSHFELYYEGRPDAGISNVFINDTLATSANFSSLVGFTPSTSAFNLATGKLDMYLASNTIQRLVISGLPFGRYKLSLQNTGTKNGGSTGFRMNVHAAAENSGSGMVSRRNLDDITNNRLHYASFQDDREFVTLLPEQVGLVSGNGGSGSGTGGLTVLPVAKSGLVDLEQEPYFFGVYCDWAMDADPIASPFSPVDSSVGYSAPALFQGNPKGLLLAYDCSRTYTSVGAAVALDSAPSWAVNPSDLVGGMFQPLGASNPGIAVLIIAASSLVNLTLETSITTVAVAESCGVKQAMHTKDLVQFKPGTAGDNQSVADRLPLPVPVELQPLIQKDLATIIVDSEASTAAGSPGNDPIYGSPLISYSANMKGLRTDGTTPDTADSAFWSVVQTFPKYQEQPLPNFAPPAGTDNERLFLRMFAAQTTGAGTVNLLRWAAVFLENLEEGLDIPVNTSFAFGYADNSGAPTNCTIAPVGGKTRVTFNNPYNFGAFPNTTDSILEVIVDGNPFPRKGGYVNIPTGGFFTEVDSFHIDLDSDYSLAPHSVTIDIRYKQKLSQINIGTFSPLVWVDEGTVALSGAPFDAPRSIFEPRNFTRLRLSARNTGTVGTTTVQIYKNASLVASGTLPSTNAAGSNLTGVLVSSQPDDIITAQVSSVATNCTDLSVELA